MASLRSQAFHSGIWRQRLCLWRQVPLYSSYICQSSLETVIADTVAGARAGKRQQVIAAAEACELSSDLAYGTFFHLAVAAHDVVARGGKPESFVTDIFVACFASCLHRLLGLSLSPTSDPDSSSFAPDSGRSDR